MTTTKTSRKSWLLASVGVLALTLAAMPLGIGHHGAHQALDIVQNTAQASDDGGHDGDSEGDHGSGGDDSGHSDDSGGNSDGGSDGDGSHSSDSSGHDDDSSHGESDGYFDD